MDINKELLFFFSLLGVFNGVIISVYFLFFAKEEKYTNKFLGALLLVLCARVGKSVLLFFNKNLLLLVVEVGVLACVLIGPFLYFYLLTSLNKVKKYNWKHLCHFLPILGIIFWFFFNKEPDYNSNRVLIKNLLHIIHVHWFVYIITSGILLKNTFINFFNKKSSISKNEIWNSSIFLGVVLIWIAYVSFKYTSYISGAVVFSVLFYVLFLLLFYKRKEIKQKKKQHIHKLDNLDHVSVKIKELMKNKIFINNELKMPEMAELLDLTPHQFSEYLNITLNKNFSNFINEYRINEAKKLLLEESHYTIDHISELCGFKSTSAFYTSFKKQTSMTPSIYRNSN